MNASNYSVFNALVDIIASPGRALDEVRQHPGWLWWPLLLTLALGVAAFTYYAYWVDFAWYVDQQIRALPPDAPPEAAQQTREFLTPGRVAAFAGVAIVVVTLVVYLLQSVYLHLANKLTTGAEIGFGQWFAFSTWTAFVGIIVTLAMFVVILLSPDNRLAQHELNPLSFNQLVFRAEPGDAWFGWASSLSLVNLWMLVLMSLGYHRWTGASRVKSTIIAVLPWVLVFGLWAAVILF